LKAGMLIRATPPSAPPLPGYAEKEDAAPGPASVVCGQVV